MTEPAATIVLRKGKEESLLRRHPWVFSGALEKVPDGLADGAAVRVLSRAGKVLGSGHYHNSSIAVRILSFEGAGLGQAFWNERIAEAWALRERVGLAGSSTTNVFRLVSGEGDGLSGLIVDYYNGVAVLQCHTAGMHLSRERIAAALEASAGAGLKAVYDRSRESLPARHAASAANGFVAGSCALPHPVKEYGHDFLVNLEEGQKTGFYIDQRENRRLLQRYAAGRSVLNAFSYTGGFSVYALAGGAELVHSVDSSRKAVEMAERHVSMVKAAGKHEAFAADAFAFLKEAGGQYDVIVLDPPSFARHRTARHQAVGGYRRLNEEALRRIRPGGLLFTFSCTQVVDRPLFESTVLAAAIGAGRSARILHRLGQPPDHPVSIFHAEGEYLKGLVLHVG